MFNNYNLLTTNLFVVYLILRIFTFLPKRLLLLAILILLCFNFISITSDNQTIFYFVTGFINYFSFSSFILLIFIIATTFASKRITIFPYTSIAFFINNFYILWFILYRIIQSLRYWLQRIFSISLRICLWANTTCNF